MDSRCAKLPAQDIREESNFMSHSLVEQIPNKLFKYKKKLEKLPIKSLIIKIW